MSPWLRVSLLALRVALGVALCWIVASKTGGFAAAMPAFAAPELFAPVIAFSIVGAVLEAWRLLALVEAQGLALAFGESFRLVTAAFAFNFCIPGGATGDLSKLYYLRLTYPGRGWELATVVFVDRLVGLFSLLLTLIVLGLLDWRFVRGSSLVLTLYAMVACAMVVILAFAACFLTAGDGLRARLARRIAVLPLGRWLSQVGSALARYRGRRGALLRALVYSVLGNLAGVAVFTLLGWKLYSLAAFPTPALLSLLGTFANTITITPGGLGVGEAAFDQLFAEANLSGGAAMMLVWRVGMLPLCLLGIAFYFGGLRPSSRKSAQPVDPKAAP